MFKPQVQTHTIGLYMGIGLGLGVVFATVGVLMCRRKQAIMGQVELQQGQYNHMP